ncbi:MAG: hypothetical protein OXJ36_03840 [bacterium]|nr:hypothetical protein [bacterium]MDE0437516.1 hypothetical protein [bacterium]
MFATSPDLRVYDHSHGDFHILRGGTSTFPQGPAPSTPQPQSPPAAWSVNVPPRSDRLRPRLAGREPRHVQTTRAVSSTEFLVGVVGLVEASHLPCRELGLGLGDGPA